jgi:cardiolipin synthase (CMP-forming)
VRLLNIPNTLTVLRIVIVPVFVTAIIYSRNDYALYLFAAAAVTDLLDGLIARVADQKTALGTFLDPLADKFLLITSFVLFSVFGWIPKWLAIAVISRDLIVVVGWLLIFMVTHNSRIEAVLLGKTAIALQLFILAYVLLEINIPRLPDLPGPFLLLAAAATCISGLQYIYKGLKLAGAA